MGILIREPKMLIEQYSFHDGTLFDIEPRGSDLVLTMESPCITPDEISDNQQLSIVGTFRGKLHIETVTSILEGDKPITQFTKKGYEHGNIYSFCLEEHSILIVLWWSRWVEKRCEETDFFTYRINANNFYWENTPTATAPFDDGPIETYSQFFIGGAVSKIDSISEPTKGPPRVIISIESALFPIHNIIYPITKKGSTIGNISIQWPLSALVNGISTPWSTLSRQGRGLIKNFVIKDHKLLLEIDWEGGKLETLLIDCWAIHWRPNSTQAAARD